MTFSRYGAKASMIAGFVGVSVSAVLAYTATHFSQLIFSVFVFGFFEAGVPVHAKNACIRPPPRSAAQAFYTVAKTSYFRSAVHPTLRGRVIAVQGGLNRFSRVIGPAVGGYLSHVAGAMMQSAARFTPAGIHAPFFVQAFLPPIAIFFVATYLPHTHSSTTGTRVSDGMRV